MSSFQDENKIESSTQTNEIKLTDNKNNNEKHRFEGKVSAEQEISASVARKRRNISKKRSESAHRPREVTPARDLAPETNETTEDLPKTPERKLRKTSSNSSNTSNNNGNNRIEKETTTPEPKNKTEDGDPKGQDVKKLPEELQVKPPEITGAVPLDKKLEDAVAAAEVVKVEDKPVDKETGTEGTVQKNVKVIEAPESKKPPKVTTSTMTGTGSVAVTGKVITAENDVEVKKTVATPPREKPARMKRDKLIKKRSQSQPRPSTEEDDKGSKIDLEAEKERLKKEQVDVLSTKKVDLPKPKPIRNKEIIPISPESILSPSPRDLVEDFKQAQVLSAKLEVQFKPSSSESSVESSGSSQNGTVRRRKPLAPAAQQYLERRKLEKQLSASKEDEKPEMKRRIFNFKNIRTQWRQFKVDYSDECQRIKNLRNRCLNEIGLMMIFCGIGGLIFKFTEGALENFYKCGVKRVKRDFIDLLWIKSHNLREEDWKALARVRLRDFEEQLHTAHEAGVHSYSGQRSWSFLNGIVYSLTIVTTIGYGHMYPTTTTGRALTIVYALIGIPLFLIILTDFGKLFTRVIKFVWAFVRRLYYTGTCKKARKTTAVKEVMKGAQMMYDLATFRRPSQFMPDDPNRPTNIVEQNVVPHTSDIEGQPETPAPSNFEIDDEFNLPISVALTILIIYMFAGAVVYFYWEEWDFFASFYFVFISMSTIGFGDYVPRHPICMIVSIIYLVFGLALMSMCINVVQVKLSDTFRQASTKLGATIGLAVSEEDGSITAVPPPTVEIPDVHSNNTSS